MTSSISSPTAPSTSSSSWVYDVFLNFRGKDTRNTITAHLHTALNGKGLRTYKDEDDLREGDQISSALLQAIECSRIFIIILSEDYASSTWCLDELVKILQYKESKQQKVLPIFYHVDPSDVRYQRESFEKALAKHAERLNGDMKLQMWKEALREVANLSGYHLKNGNESEFLERIVQGVSRMANDHLYLYVAKHPVGLKPRVEDVNSRLNVGKNDIRIVGILGVSGIGKTTLAKAIYNSIAFQFEASCFLADVSNNSNDGDLVKLQDTLISEIFGDCRSLKVGNSEARINLIKHRLPSKRVLLILDGVEQPDQLEKLAGARDWFGKGSRILITTTNQHLLTTHEVDSTYEMTGLNHDHAIQLFCWHAFKKEKPVDGYEKFVEQIIDYAESHPLLLTLLGSDLYKRSQSEWICALDQYKKIPHQKIQDRFLPIYRRLSDIEQRIFLDIACFFIGDPFEVVIKILDSFGFCPNFWIPRLEEKCLISFHNFTGRLQMHDLVRDIGRYVVRKESPENPGARSRLFIPEDVREVLQNNTGTNNIEAILVDLPEGNDNIRLSRKAFKKMKRLRFFRCLNVHFSGDHLDYLPNGLKVIDWRQCPLQSMPPEFRGDELVILQMPCSLMREISCLESKNLTVMDFAGCEFLTKISDLSGCPNLKEINISCCSKLVEVHDSIGLLDQLVEFDFSECYNLKSFPKIFRLKSLKNLDGSCSGLQKFPEIECEMEHLRTIDLTNSAIEELPSSIGYLTGLTMLRLQDCVKLKRLPSGITRASSLWLLAAGCISLDSLPESKIFHLPRLQCIDFSGCYKLNMGNCMSIPAWNQGMMTFPGNKIPNWFSYCKEASNSHWCEFDIEVDPPYSDDIVGIAFCAVIQPERTGDIFFSCMHKFFGGFHNGDLDHHHVWLGYMKREHSDLYFGQDVDNLRITFESIRNSVMFVRCGVRLLYKKHEQNEKDLEGIGNLANSKEGVQLSKNRRADYNDDVDDDDYDDDNDHYDHDNYDDDIHYNDDSDHYDDDNDDACNIASNLSTQQMKTSSTLAIKIFTLL